MFKQVIYKFLKWVFIGLLKYVKIYIETDNDNKITSKEIQAVLNKFKRKTR